MNTTTPDEDDARELVEQWKADCTLLPDTTPHKGWWCVKDSELLAVLTTALDAVRRETEERVRKEYDKS